MMMIENQFNRSLFDGIVKILNSKNDTRLGFMNAAQHTRTRNSKNLVKTIKKIAVCEHKKTVESNDDSDLLEGAHDQTPRRPNFVKGCQWMEGRTLRHGISLHTLVRKSAALSGPCFLRWPAIIKVCDWWVSRMFIETYCQEKITASRVHSSHIHPNTLPPTNEAGLWKLLD